MFRPGIGRLGPTEATDVCLPRWLCGRLLERRPRLLQSVSILILRSFLAGCKQEMLRGAPPVEVRPQPLLGQPTKPLLQETPSSWGKHAWWWSEGQAGLPRP